MHNEPNTNWQKDSGCNEKRDKSMAKVINMFVDGDEDKRVASNKNTNWRVVLTGKEFYELS